MSRPFQVFLGGNWNNEASAGTATASSEGYTFCDWLEPMIASMTINGEIGELRCVGDKHPDDALSLISYGQAIQVLDYRSDSDGVVVFDGAIVKKHMVIQGDTDKFEVIALNNADYLMHRICLHGQTRRSHAKEQSHFTSGDSGSPISVSSSDVVKIDSPLWFNPNGSPNMTVETFYWSSSTTNNAFNIFEVPDRYQKNGSHLLQASAWTLSAAVKYLLNFYNTSWAVNPISLETSNFSVFGTFGDPVVSNVNLEGKSLLEGLKTLLDPNGYGFTVSPAGGTDGSQHILYFFYRTVGTSTTTVTLSSRGTAAWNSAAEEGATKSNVISLDLLHDSTPVVNNVKGVGDRLEFTTLAHTNPPSSSGVMTLSQGWQAADLVWPTHNADGSQNTMDITFRKQYCSPTLMTNISGSPGVKAYGVGRLWLVNQGEIPGVTLEDLAADLHDSSNTTCSIDPRQLEKPGLYNQNSPGGVLKQEDVVVEMSTDGGDTWGIIEKHWYRVLPDSMGIVFTEPHLEKLGLRIGNSIYPDGYAYWDALHDASLQIRILCSVRSDERLSVARTNGGTAVPLATERFFENPGYRKVTYNSAINSTTYYTQYPPLESTQDDTTALGNILDRQLSLTSRVSISGNIVVTLDSDFTQYTAGMTITEIEGREISLSPPPLIVRVVWDFAAQHVQLILDNHRVGSVLKGKPVLPGSLDQHKLGVVNPVALSGGNQVNYLPGVRSSQMQFYESGGGQ